MVYQSLSRFRASRNPVSASVPTPFPIPTPACRALNINGYCESIRARRDHKVPSIPSPSLRNDGRGGVSIVRRKCAAERFGAQFPDQGDDELYFGVILFGRPQGFRGSAVITLNCKSIRRRTTWTLASRSHVHTHTARHRRTHHPRTSLQLIFHAPRSLRVSHGYRPCVTNARLRTRLVFLRPRKPASAATSRATISDLRRMLHIVQKSHERSCTSRYARITRDNPDERRDSQSFSSQR